MFIDKIMSLKWDKKFTKFLNFFQEVFSSSLFY